MGKITDKFGNPINKNTLKPVKRGPLKNKQKEVKEQIDQTPLTLCGKKMVNVQIEKCLGEMLCTAGLSESVHATVLKRKGQF